MSLNVTRAALDGAVERAARELDAARAAASSTLGADVYVSLSASTGEPVALWSLSTSRYAYRGAYAPDGQTAHRIDPGGVEPTRAHRRAHGVMVRAESTDGRRALARVLAAHVALEAARLEQTAATFWRVVRDGAPPELHYSARGAEIAAKLHPGAVVVPPRVSA